MFISADDNFLNLDLVAEVQHTANGRGFIFKSTDGRMLGSLRHADGLDLEELAAPVVAAAPGTTAVIILACNLAKDRPTEADILVEHVPVIAWRVVAAGLIPLFIEAPTKSAVVLHEMPDGRVLRPDYAAYEDLAAAKADILGEAQASWDRDRNPTRRSAA